MFLLFGVLSSVSTVFIVCLFDFKSYESPLLDLSRMFMLLRIPIFIPPETDRSPAKLIYAAVFLCPDILSKIMLSRFFMSWLLDLRWFFFLLVRLWFDKPIIPDCWRAFGVIDMIFDCWLFFLSRDFTWKLPLRIGDLLTVPFFRCFLIGDCSAYLERIVSIMTLVEGSLHSSDINSSYCILTARVSVKRSFAFFVFFYSWRF